VTLISHIPEQDLPLCPVGRGQPGHELHQVANAVLDAFYNAGDKDPETGEFTSPEVDRAYTAAARVVCASMRLYRENLGYDTQVAGRIVHTVVQTHYFRCQICGFTLPVDKIGNSLEALR
jgi:hypothetical protein